MLHPAIQKLSYRYGGYAVLCIVQALIFKVTMCLSRFLLCSVIGIYLQKWHTLTMVDWEEVESTSVLSANHNMYFDLAIWEIFLHLLCKKWPYWLTSDTTKYFFSSFTFQIPQVDLGSLGTGMLRLHNMPFFDTCLWSESRMWCLAFTRKFIFVAADLWTLPVRRVCADCPQDVVSFNLHSWTGPFYPRHSQDLDKLFFLFYAVTIFHFCDW